METVNGPYWSVDCFHDSRSENMDTLTIKNDQSYRQINSSNNRWSIKKWLKSYWKNRYLFLLLFPCIAYFIIFHYLPMYGIVLAFKEYRFIDGIMGSPFNNFQNFKDLFSGRDFPVAFRNTIILSLYRIIFSFPAPVILAILLNEVKKIKFKKFIQTASYLPHFMSWVVLAGIFMELLSPSRGVVNQIITMLGGKPIFFFGDPKWFRTLLITTSIWQSVGWNSIIYLASLSSIDPMLYEASVVDGAGRWKQMIHITLPSMVPIITINAIFAVGGVISDNFDQVFNFYNPAVYKVADVLSTYTYRIGIGQMEYGLATATGLFVNVINFALLIITNAIVKRYSEYAIW